MGYQADGRLESFGEERPFRDAAERTTRRVGALLRRLTTDHTPVAKGPPGHELDWLEQRKRLPGTLKRSWRVGEVTVSQDGTLYSIDVYTLDPIAPYVEWPTLPHIIVPRKPGGVLRFWDRLGNTIYATIVHHSGTKGSYMLTTSLGEIAALWQEIGAQEMESWAREQEALI